MNLSTPRAVLSVLVGFALVMIPAGALYSLTFIALDALFPDVGFTQASHSTAAVAWRILTCLLCAAAAGSVTQKLSKQSRATAALACVCLLCGIMGVDNSGLYHDTTTAVRLILASALALTIYASGRCTCLKGTLV